MTRPDDAALQVLQGLWQADSSSVEKLDDIDAPKVCKRTTGLDFGGFADPADVGADGDLRTAWRAKLAREGKLSTSGQSVRELVLGPDSTASTADSAEVSR
jgi:hypothetical protein